MRAENHVDGQLIPFEHYAVRPFRQKGESFQGWIYRFYAENGRMPCSRVKELVEKLYRVGFSEDERDQLIPQAKKLFGKYGVFDYWMWFYEPRKRIQRLRFCPKCFSIWPFHQEVWELLGVQACPLHECELIQSCQKCGHVMPAQYSANTFQCACGSCVFEQASKAAPAAFVSLARTIAFQSGVSVPYACDSAWARDDEMPLRAWYSLMYCILDLKARINNSELTLRVMFDNWLMHPDLAVSEARFLVRPFDDIDSFLERVGWRYLMRGYKGRGEAVLSMRRVIWSLLSRYVCRA